MSSKVLLRRKMLCGWFDLFFILFFNGYVEDLIWHWFLIWQRCCGADLILISCGRRCWGWFGVDFSLKKIYLILRLIWNRFLIFFLGWYLFHLSRCRRSRGWTASFTGEPGRGISREFARWVELVGFFRRCTMYQPGHHVISGHQD